MKTSNHYYVFYIFLALLLIFFIYSFGLSGAFFYDDYGNLDGLVKIKNFEDAKSFVFSGFAGPTGRPIALLSFIPHASNWPNNGQTIIFINILIHLVNAFLIGFLGYSIIEQLKKYNKSEVFYIAFFAALLWASMPLLASTTLISIQRMTGLSALFGLLGLIIFSYGYRFQYQNPVFTFFLQMGGLGFFTLLSIFTKENGALIPLYALLINAFIFPSKKNEEHWLIKLRALLLWGALFSILLYLSPLVQDYFSISEIRGYSVMDRLQTQVVILWQYLQVAFFPMPSAYSPFHDYRGAGYTAGTGVLALLAWFGIIFICIYLKIKHNVIFPLFALLWYLLGHLLESTSILLEIYFEHRNYLPIYGFCLALALGAFSIAHQYRKLAISLLIGYIGLHMAVLFSVTSVWGKPQIAAEIWAKENPESSRAVLHAVFQQLGQGNSTEVARISENWIQRERYEKAIENLDRTIEHCDTCLGVRMQAVIYSCMLKNSEQVKNRFNDVISIAERGKDTRVVLDTIFKLREMINENACPNLQREDLLQLIKILRTNTLFKIEHILTKIYFIAASLEDDLGNNASMEKYLSLAENTSPTALPVLQYQIYIAQKNGDFAAAKSAIERRYPYITKNQGAMKKETLDQMLEEIELTVTP